MLIVINKMILMYISFISKLNVKYVFKLYVLINNLFLLVMLFINCEKQVIIVI